MNIAEAIEALGLVQDRVDLCDEVIGYLVEIRNGATSSVLVGSSSRTSNEVDSLISYLDKYRLEALSELDRIKKIEVPRNEGADNSKK